MNTPNIFPLHYNCHDTYGWADCPALAKRVWMRIRTTVAPDLIWYGVAMKIKSASHLSLYVYEIADSFSGGIGNQIFKCDVSRATLTPDECAMLDDLLIKAYTSYAESELDKREQAERQQQIVALRKELFGV